MAEAGTGTADGSGAPLAELRGVVGSATTRLLGDSIAVSDRAWRAPSRLPDWTRAHVATHLARQADALVRLASWAETGRRQAMYGSAQQRDDEIAAGAGRSGLDLQIDLDTTCGALEAAFDRLEQGRRWDEVVELRGGLAVPARLLPLARLTEVVLHHVDLDVGYEVDDIDETTAGWLLEWSAFRLRSRAEFPHVQLTADTGVTVSVGSSGHPLPVRGSSARLLGWLTGRSDPSTVSGADGLVLPSF